MTKKTNKPKNLKEELVLLEEKITKLEELNNRLKYILEDIRFQRRR